MPAAKLSARFFLCCAALVMSALAGPGQAQTTYRWIDKATGQTVFSDHPPPPGAKLLETKGGAARDDENALPYAVRQAATKYPVTLYTAANCTELCASARTLLNGRGVPFSEKMLNNPEESAAVAKQMGNEAFVPGLTVGSQNHPGFDAGAWNNLLDLAGYPKNAPYGSKPSGTFAP